MPGNQQLRPYTRNFPIHDYYCNAPGCTRTTKERGRAPKCPTHGIPMKRGKKPSPPARRR